MQRKNMILFLVMLALVLVHGAISDHSRWAPVLPLLQPHFTVYAADRRGRGASGDTPPYAPEQRAPGAPSRRSSGCAQVRGGPRS